MSGTDSSQGAISPRRAMQRALILARKGMGSVRPNPPVGAVVVKNGNIVGEGYHERFGGDHAEIEALRAAGRDARDAEMYVTLEPCNHYGKTPPCSLAIREAGIRKVHIAHRDPNIESAAGAAALREMGVEVSFGPCRREAAYLVAGFASRVLRGRPRFVLKLASSIDGRIASAGGDSRWISSGVARGWVHRRRREADAVLVGAETAARDNPALTTRMVAGRSPDRIVVDSTLRIPPTARVWTDDGARRIVLTTGAASVDAREALADKGVDVWEVEATEGGRVSLPSAARRLAEAGYTSILVEGGGAVAGSFFHANLVDEAHVFMSRKMLLGGGGPGWTESLNVPSVARAVKLVRTDLRSMGPDWWITLVPESAQWWDPETFGDEPAESKSAAVEV